MSFAILNIPGSNRRNIENAIAHFAGYSFVERPNEILDVSWIILPGVGHFSFYMEFLNRNGWKEYFSSQKFLKNKARVLGICAGFHALCEKSEEAEGVSGLGIFPFNVIKCPVDLSVMPRVKSPHVGLKPLIQEKHDSIILPESGFFSHNFGVTVNGSDHVLQTVKIGNYDYVASVFKEKYIGIQYHPELSGEAGRRLFSDLVKKI